MTTPTRNPEEFIEELWGYANEVPMAEHPWFKGMIEHRWTPEQIVLGEIQHYLRVKTNVIYFGHIIRNAAQADERELLATVMENFSKKREARRAMRTSCSSSSEEAGLSREAADHAEPSPGTAAAIEVINGICLHRSALEGISAIAFLESQHGSADGVAAKVYRALTDFYGFSARAAETYSVHAEQDVGHGGRQIEAIKKHAIDAEMQEKVRRAVKLGVTAYTLEWDGHVQAMTGRREFWGGVAPLYLNRPAVRTPAVKARQE